ncbi:MAG: hypothetical protein CL933_11830 [Deltaproteobacteria bacterium]|nr:hypothetical protein [Deltaproteobacteria bacterium]
MLGAATSPNPRITSRPLLVSERKPAAVVSAVNVTGKATWANARCVRSLVWLKLATTWVE